MTTILYLFFFSPQTLKILPALLILSWCLSSLITGKREAIKQTCKQNLSCASNTMSIILSVSFPIQYSDFPPCTFLSPNSDPQLVKSSLTCSKTFLQPIFLLNLYISSFSIIHPKQEQNITTSTPKKHHPGSSSCSSMFPCSNLS